MNELRPVLGLIFLCIAGWCYWRMRNRPDEVAGYGNVWLLIGLVLSLIIGGALIALPPQG
jgi:hypothetical protein